MGFSFVGLHHSDTWPERDFKREEPLFQDSLSMIVFLWPQSFGWYRKVDIKSLGMKVFCFGSDTTSQHWVGAKKKEQPDGWVGRSLENIL